MLISGPNTDNEVRWLVITVREQKLLEQHILLLAALDQQMMTLANHQRLIDVMVDAAADVSSDHV